MDKSYQLEMFDKSIKILHEFETADEIRGFLVSQEIKAIPNDALACAITKYVKSNLPEGSRVQSRVDAVNLLGPDMLPIESVVCTNAMFDFMCKFDGNAYPELIK